MALNYTVETVAVTFEGDSLVANSFPVTLIVTPDEGYTVDAADFSVESIVDSSGQVSPILGTIAQGGDQVFITITTDAPGSMPLVDIELLVDIDGEASLPPVTIAGDLIIQHTNVSFPAVSSTYSMEGQPGEIVEILSLNIEADADYKLTNLYSVIVALTNEYLENYDVNIVETLSSGEVTEIDITINYTLPAESVTGDIINITANAEEAFTPSVVYTAYSQEDTLLRYEEVEWGAKILGSDGATATITVHDTTADVAVGVYDFVVGSGPNSNQIKASITLPAVLVDSDYTLTFSGDIDPGFTQTNPLVVQRRDLQREVTFTVANVAGYGITLSYSPIIGVAGSPFGVEEAVVITVESMTLGNLVDVSSVPTVADQFSNLDPLSNGGTDILQYSTATVAGGGTTDMTITYFVEAFNFGTTDVVCDIDLSAILTDTAP